ncbi:protein kinase [Trypanosoma rangeli]|uniref:Protein kinase n=1 Tax=Trypanosoma rangeli TaxID=5698 RepID=A0A422NQ59_TRYRA|nr:protein kinase [Trypanosoma rangeli]RNF07586.1 protein kinase [Trypanosoma rangeli]|eukprot:RNF07586.1 protein kinase [Trypanosoma rangeli]
MTPEPPFDYSTVVAILSHTAVFKQNCHARYTLGPVALKVTTAPSLLPASHKGDTARVGHEDHGDRASVSCHDGVAHPTLHEAMIYALVCPHPSIPVFVECVEDLFDTSCFLAKEKRCAPQRLPVLVTQFVKAASIDRFFHTFRVLRWSVAVQVAHQVASVLQHVHSKGVVYGDLKLPNVLLGDGGHVWLVDFASAVVVRSGVDDSEMRGVVGREELARGITCHLQAPELLPTARAAETEALLAHPFMVDFWAFGTFLFELLTGQPFMGSFVERSGNYTQDELQIKVLEGCSLAEQRYRTACGPRYSPGVWNALRDLLTGLMQRSPERRLGFGGGWGEVLRHRFFRVVEVDLHEPFPAEYAEENNELTLGL